MFKHFSSQSQVGLSKRDIKKLDELKATRIMVVGSYGQDLTAHAIEGVLSEKLQVSNFVISSPSGSDFSKFIKSVNKHDDVIIIRANQTKSGDILRLASILKPTVGVITGISRSHVPKGTAVKSIVESYLELGHYMAGKTVYKNRGSGIVSAFTSYTDEAAYDHTRIGECIAQDIKMTPEKGLSFNFECAGKSLQIRSRLIGEDAIAACLVAAKIGLDYELDAEQIESGLKKLVPTKHSMEPHKVGGGWLINDTSNNHPEGIAIGLRFLKDCKASKRIYATAGLVDSNHNIKDSHTMIGHLVASSSDLVYLVHNQMTEYIVAGLSEAHYAGEILYVNNPLEFYQQIEKFIGDGDVLLIQNHWPGDK